MSDTVRIPAWRYPLLGPYNGFTGLERARGAQLTWWALKARILPNPDHCSVCSKPPPRLQVHNEDYYDPLQVYAVCPACHMTLHRRFRSPAAWEALVVAHTREDAWFVKLSPTPIDLAAKLRQQRGQQITDILATVIAQLPPDVPRPVGALLEAANCMTRNECATRP